MCQIAHGNMLLLSALGYARRGWSVIPTKGKKATCTWLSWQSKLPSETSLKRWFAKDGVTGIAVITGKVSGGLAIRDFDTQDAYNSWAMEHPGDSERLPTVRTVRGFHVYGVLDEEQYLSFLDGELRGDSRHYTLVPPSLHPDGGSYIWKNPLPEIGVPLLPLPLSLTQSDSSNPSNPVNPLHGLHAQLDDSQVDRLIDLTLPSGPGQRNRRLFDLARSLKAISPIASPRQLHDIVQRWHQLALPYIRTKEFDESWEDFVVAWDRVKSPTGQSFTQASQAAETESPPPVADAYVGNLRRLVCLCWQLAKQWGDSPFPLGCHKTGEYLGVSPVQAWRLLKVLRFDQVIERVTKGRKATKRASEWRFVSQE